MRKIINGKRYDTDTATLLGGTSYGCIGDLTYWAESLYRKKTGEYFLCGVGGPGSKYSRHIGPDRLVGWTEIRPLSLQEAQEWAEACFEADDYEAVFGPVEE